MILENTLLNSTLDLLHSEYVINIHLVECVLFKNLNLLNLIKLAKYKQFPMYYSLPKICI